MATIGNLELRIGKDTLYGSTTHDGGKVYDVIQRLSDFLDETPKPTIYQYKEWFRKTAKELLPYEHRTEFLGGNPKEVIIDTRRKLLIYNGDLDDIGHLELDTFDNLENNHLYQFLEFKSVGKRQ